MGFTLFYSSITPVLSHVIPFCPCKNPSPIPASLFSGNGHVDCITPTVEEGCGMDLDPGLPGGSVDHQAAAHVPSHVVSLQCRAAHTGHLQRFSSGTLSQTYGGVEHPVALASRAFTPAMGTMGAHPDHLAHLDHCGELHEAPAHAYLLMTYTLNGLRPLN